PPINARFIDPRTGTTRRDTTALQSTGKPLYPVGKYVCEDNITQSGATGCTGANRFFVCIGATGDLSFNAGNSLDGAANPYGVASGNIIMLAGMNGGLCPASSAVKLFDTSTPTPGPPVSYSGFPYTNILRAFPVGDGSFIAVVSNTFTSVMQFGPA